MGHDFTVKVNAHDDCDLASVAIDVAPQGLSASTKKGPYQWDLTGIDGAQTITVTATDGSGHATVASIHISAPPPNQASPPDAGTSPAAGCTVASGAFGAAGLLPRSRFCWYSPAARVAAGRRRITGALAESDA